MKKIFSGAWLVILFVVMVTTPSLAQLGVGARAAGMGSAYVALADDITAAYYNPAGIMNSGMTDFKVSLGAGINNLQQMLAMAQSPSQFIEDNFNNSISFLGGVNTLLGLAINKIGLSAVALGNLSFTKPAGSTAPSGVGSITEDLALTLGTSLGIPGLPIGDLDIGGSVKYILGQRYLVTSTGATTFNQTMATASGMGFDIGCQAQITPLIKGGIALRNIGTNINWSGTTKGKQIDPGTGAVTDTGAETSYSASETRPMITAIGVASTLPWTGTTVAAEVDSSSSGSTTHIGAEQFLIPGFLALRAGYIIGTSANPGITIWTVGLGLNFPIFNLQVAYANDTLHSTQSVVVDILAMGF